MASVANPTSANMATAGITAGAGLLGSLVGYFGAQEQRDFESEEAAKQRMWNARMLERQNEWSLEQWNRENAYNNPSAQIQRLKDAGLNPLYYGLDGSSASSIQSAQVLGYDRASGTFANPLGASVSSGLDTAIATAEVMQKLADTAKKNNENITETQKRQKIMVEMAETQAKIKKLLSDTNLNEDKRNQIQKALDWSDRLYQAQLNEIDSRVQLSESQKKRIDALLPGEVQLQRYTLHDFEERWSKIRKEIEVLSKEIGIKELDLEYYALNHMTAGWQGTGLSVQNLVQGWIMGKDAYDKYRSSRPPEGGGSR